MRGNPFVNLVAILVMFLSVLTAGKVWIDWKVREPVRKELQIQKKDVKVETFEQAVKHTN